MERILAVNCSAGQTGIIKKIAGDMKLRLQLINDEQSELTLDELTAGNISMPEDTIKADGTKSLLIFCDLEDSRLDHVLARLRTDKAGICYKAVLTPTNRSWELKKLYVHMEMEKAAMKAQGYGE